MPCGCVLLAYVGLSIGDGPARSVQFQIDSWNNQSWGFHDIARQRVRCEEGVAGDGSRTNRCERESFHHYFVLEGRWKWRSLYLRAEHAGFEIDDAARTARGGPCSCTWEHHDAKPDDNECTRTAAGRLPGAKLTGAGEVAGRAVVRYSYIDEDGMRTELSLAPLLACEVMDQVRLWPGALGIPAAKWHYRVTSYTAGEPDQSQFRIPDGYTVQLGRR